MSAGGDASLAVAYSRVGMTELPPGSNEGPWWNPFWGCNLGSWCAAFVSWCSNDAGYPLPILDPSCSGTATGFVGCMSGTVNAWCSGEVPAVAEPGDILIFSWYPWELQGGVPIITSGEYAGWVAGDHTGYLARDLGGGYLLTVEGNTGANSWDNGGAVLERSDRYWGQVCAVWRPSSFGGGGGGIVVPPDEEEDEVDMMRIVQQVGAGGSHGEGTVWAISPSEPKAWPIANQYTVDVLQAHGVLMNWDQMDAHGWTRQTDGGSIASTYAVQPTIESIPDS